MKESLDKLNRMTFEAIESTTHSGGKLPASYRLQQMRIDACTPEYRWQLVSAETVNVKPCS